MKTLLKNVKLHVNEEWVDRELLMEDKAIVQIAESIETEPDQIIDGNGNLLAPGFVDIHIHLREPGGEKKETIATGTRAAARGGFTTVCSMPNTQPVPDDAETMGKLMERIESDATVRVLPYAAITKRQLGKELVDMKALKHAGAVAFTDDGVGVQEAGQMLRAMEQAAQDNHSIVAHCEDNSLKQGGAIHKGKTSEKLGIPGIPSVCESVHIARDVLLAEAAGCHYHVCHVSTKESVRVIRDAKRAGINVTAEVTPHHLLLNEEDIRQDDTMFKMNPPLRSKEDQQALIDGLLDGTIDCIATDHAPHTEADKQEDILTAPFGIVGLETAFPLLYSHLVKKDILTLEQLIDMLTVKPANVFGLPYGKIVEGAPADLTLLDIEHKQTIDRHNFYSKGKNTPFHGWDVIGFPAMTIAEGKIVWEAE
ncbi:dihydroorotase [Thalassobacillus pellis]|uniref:dihydroorotase n=1 Tax=Thalassobacillus pellis TaxID=748008 RepID=UPI001960FB5B|nr:dihydroorotase [Thalassobacillus pellis]MBM7552827.1 dihydroorotase [Thalassobacillus pellis]